MREMNEMVAVLLLCLFGGGLYISFVILVARGIRKDIYRKTELLRESKEKEIELMQAQIDYYNSMKEKEQNNVNNGNWQSNKKFRES